MNTKNNRAFRDNEEKIQKALMTLPRAGNQEGITVQRICDEAKINRTTFYAHFTDLHDLVKKSEVRFRERLKAEFDADCIGEVPQAFQLFLLRHIQAHADFYRLYFLHRNPFENNLGPEQAWASVGEMESDQTASSPQNHYSQAFRRSGVAAVLEQWVKQGCLDEPEHIQSLLLQHLPENIL